MEQVPLMLDGHEIGAVTIREGCACARASLLDDGLYRAYLRGQNGEMLLGVLEPYDGVLRAEKRLPAAKLAALGTIRDAQARRSFSFAAEKWERVPEVPLFADAALSRRVAAIPGGRYRRDGRGTCLAFPYAPDRAFPLIERFCFAQIRAVEGQLCAVYCLDEQGFPIF